MGLGDAAELSLPVAVQDDPVDVAAVRRGFPAELLGGVEAHEVGGAFRVVGVEHGLDGVLIDEFASDPGGDSLARDVGELLVHELRREGVAAADKVIVEPLAGDGLEVAEEVELGLLAGVTPLCLDESLGEVEEEGGLSDLVEVFEVEVDAFADDALVAGVGGANDVGRELQRRLVGELGGELLGGEFDSVTLNAREPDLQVVAFWAYSTDVHGLPGRLRWSDDGLGGEVEGDSEHVCVLDVEAPLVIQVVGLTAEGSTDDLLTKKLRAEGSDAEHVRDGVGVPTLSEHGD